MTTRPTRLTVNVSGETLAAIRAAAEAHSTSQTEIIRRAVAIYALVESEVAQGNTVQIAGGGQIREILLV